MKILQRKTMAEEVAVLITEEIRHGQYRNREKLPNETELMKAFGVGRSTIRESTRLLNNAGLLRSRQGLGTFIETQKFYRGTDLKMVGTDFREVHELRELLEGKLTAKAAINRTTEDILRMKEILGKRQHAIQSDNAEKCVAADLELHHVIAAASGNKVLAELYSLLTSYLAPFYLILEDHQAIFSETHRDHELLLDSIERSDPEGVGRNIEKILSFFS
ncbi:FadR/GntR family transcriptional regulator [Chitinophaga sp. S165]|uniref:FadR/GntR family transcriptional regulator n=1 Tax=Chitinophaga sp. S165 TaxID=2135462 RepID=UPI000D714396|nr:FCD domain-containing protein [Chitinophaga sp. S165]PWV55877.1 DNA-binding FadR family transcriptional regulator [Chitinophaga sp. S165]